MEEIIKKIWESRTDKKDFKLILCSNLKHNDKMCYGLCCREKKTIWLSLDNISKDITNRTILLQESIYTLLHEIGHIYYDSEEEANRYAHKEEVAYIDYI